MQLIALCFVLLGVKLKSQSSIIHKPKGDKYEQPFCS